LDLNRHLSLAHSEKPVPTLSDHALGTELL
jgi:hypothetical protein